MMMDDASKSSILIFCMLVDRLPALPVSRLNQDIALKPGPQAGPTLRPGAILYIGKILIPHYCQFAALHTTLSEIENLSLWGLSTKLANYFRSVRGMLCLQLPPLLERDVPAYMLGEGPTQEGKLLHSVTVPVGSGYFCLRMGWDLLASFRKYQNLQDPPPEHHEAFIPFYFEE